MPINAGIYSQIQQPDIVGSFAKGISMRQMLGEAKDKEMARKRELAIQAAYAAGLPGGQPGSSAQAPMSGLGQGGFGGADVSDPIGGYPGPGAPQPGGGEYDPQKAMSAMGKLGAGEEAFKMHKSMVDMKQKKYQTAINQMDLSGRLFGANKDWNQQSYNDALARLHEMGVPTKGFPKEYYKGLEAELAGDAISVKDKIAAKARQDSLEFQKQQAIIGNLRNQVKDQASARETQEKRAEVQAAKAQKRYNINATADKMTDDIQFAIDLAEKSPRSSGPIYGKVMPYVPGSDAERLNKVIESLKGRIGFQTLQDMREASKTGGAVGQVSDKEQKLLQSVQGSLDVDLKTEDLVYNLKRLYNTFLKTRYGPKYEEGLMDLKKRSVNPNPEMGGSDGGDDLDESEVRWK